MAAFGQQLGIVTQLYAGLIERLLTPHGVTWPQFTVLVHLARRSTPARVSDIAQAVELTQPAVSKIVQKFVLLGLVETGRDLGDQRNRPVHLTPEGRARVGTIQQGFGPAFGALTQTFAPDDLARLTADLARLATALTLLRRADSP